MEAFANSDSRIAVLTKYKTEDVFPLLGNLVKNVPPEHSIFLFSYRGFTQEMARNILKRRVVYVNYSQVIPPEAYKVPGVVIVMAELLPLKNLLKFMEKLPEGSKMRILTKRLVSSDISALRARDDVKYYGADKGSVIDLICSKI